MEDVSSLRVTVPPEVPFWLCLSPIFSGCFLLRLGTVLPYFFSGHFYLRDRQELQHLRIDLNHRGNFSQEIMNAA